MEHNQNPTSEELEQFSLRAFKGIEAGLGQADPVASVSGKLEQLHPEHLILVQVGKFLHAYDKSAYALSVLKKYKLKLVGAAEHPHLRVGFPAGNFQRRLWPMVNEFGIPYVVALGTQSGGYTIYTSSQPVSNTNVLASVSPDIVREVIAELKQHGEVNKAMAKQMLENADHGFMLKSKAQELDSQLLRDIIKLPRDIRSTWGESVRECMTRLMRGVFAYGLAENKPAVLRSLSADIDLLKHYIAQAQKLNQVKLGFEHRAGLAVELGRLAGGMLRAQVQP